MTLAYSVHFLVLQHCFQDICGSRLHLKRKGSRWARSLEDWVQTNEDTALRAAATHPREEPEVLAAADWEPRGTLIAAS